MFTLQPHSSQFPLLGLSLCASDVLSESGTVILLSVHPGNKEFADI